MLSSISNSSNQIVDQWTDVLKLYIRRLRFYTFQISILLGTTGGTVRAGTVLRWNCPLGDYPLRSCPRGIVWGVLVWTRKWLFDLSALPHQGHSRKFRCYWTKNICTENSLHLSVHKRCVHLCPYSWVSRDRIFWCEASAVSSLPMFKLSGLDQFRVTIGSV